MSPFSAPPAHPHHVLRPRVWIPLGIVAFLLLLVVVAQIVAQPLARHYTQKGLDQMKGYRGTFSRVAFNLFTLTYTIEDLKIVQEPARDQHEPLLFAKLVRARLMWRHLLRFKLNGVAHIGQPKLIWAYTEHHKVELVHAAKKLKEKLPPLSQIDDALRAIIPFKLGRVEVTGGEVELIDGQAASRPKIWLHDLELSLENFANRRKLEAGAPATLALSGKLQRSGDLTVFVTADPLSDILRFAGQAELRHLQLSELFGVVAARTGLHMPKGVFDVHASFKSEKGHITGGVKPALRHVDVEAVGKDFGPRLKAGLADAALHVFADDPRGRDEVATNIPIDGDLRAPDVQLVPAVIALLRNAFVEGLSNSFANLPPKKATEKQGVVKQAVEGLSKKKGEPKAQPEKK